MSDQAHHGEAIGAENLFRGSRWPRALAKVNRGLLIPAELRDAAGNIVERLVSDREQASSCDLGVASVAVDGGRAVQRIQIPAHARIVPGSKAKPGRRPLLFSAVQDLAEAALKGARPPPEVLGVEIDGDREVFWHPFIVRILQKLVTLALNPLVDAAIPHTALAYRQIDGVRAGLFTARALMRRGLVWGARADIRKFFPAISIDHVANTLPRVVPTRDSYLRMLSWFMSAPIVRGTEHPSVQSGKVPMRSAPLRALYQGSSIAPLLSNVVGTFHFDVPFSVAMKGRAILLRYADDLLVLAASRATASDALYLVKALAEVGNFTIHTEPSKTSPEPVDLRGDGFTWLGYELGHGGIRLPESRFDETAESLAKIDPRDRRHRGSFIDAALRLFFDPASRLGDLREAAAAIDDRHLDAMERAMLHVKRNIRSRWIGQWQSFAAPVLGEVIS